MDKITYKELCDALDELISTQKDSVELSDEAHNALYHILIESFEPDIYYRDKP